MKLDIKNRPVPALKSVGLATAGFLGTNAATNLAPASMQKFVPIGTMALAVGCLLTDNSELQDLGKGIATSSAINGISVLTAPKEGEEVNSIVSMMKPLAGVDDLEEYPELDLNAIASNGYDHEVNGLGNLAEAIEHDEYEYLDEEDYEDMSDADLIAGLQGVGVSNANTIAGFRDWLKKRRKRKAMRRIGGKNPMKISNRAIRVANPKASAIRTKVPTVPMQEQAEAISPQYALKDHTHTITLSGAEEELVSMIG